MGGDFEKCNISIIPYSTVSKFSPTSPMTIAVMKQDAKMVEILFESNNISFQNQFQEITFGNKFLLEFEGYNECEILEEVFFNYKEESFLAINNIFSLFLKNKSKLKNIKFVLWKFFEEAPETNADINLPKKAFDELIKNLSPLTDKEDCEKLVAYYQENTAKKPREDEEGDGNDRPSKKQKVE